MSTVRPPESILRKISKVLFPLWGIRAGLYLTGQHIFRKKFTVQYPEHRREPDINYRGKISLLNRGTIEDEICVSCLQCMNICPVNCIHIIPKKGDDKKRHVHIFDVDMNKCLFCNLCAETCPEICIVLDPIYDYSSYSHDGLYNTVEGISRPATSEELRVMERVKAEEEARKAAEREAKKKDKEAKDKTEKPEGTEG